MLNEYNKTIEKLSEIAVKENKNSDNIKETLKLSNDLKSLAVKAFIKRKLGKSYLLYADIYSKHINDYIGGIRNGKEII